MFRSWRCRRPRKKARGDRGAPQASAMSCPQPFFVCVACPESVAWFHQVFSFWDILKSLRPWPYGYPWMPSMPYGAHMAPQMAMAMSRMAPPAGPGAGQRSNIFTPPGPLVVRFSNLPWIFHVRKSFQALQWCQRLLQWSPRCIVFWQAPGMNVSQQLLNVKFLQMFVVWGQHLYASLYYIPD